MGLRPEARWKVRFRPLLRAQGIFMGCPRAVGRGSRLHLGLDAPLARVPCGSRRGSGGGVGACGKWPRAPNLGTLPQSIRRRQQPGSGEFPPPSCFSSTLGRAEGGGKGPGEGGRCGAPSATGVSRPRRSGAAARDSAHFTGGKLRRS